MPRVQDLISDSSDSDSDSAILYSPDSSSDNSSTILVDSDSSSESSTSDTTTSTQNSTELLSENEIMRRVQRIIRDEASDSDDNSVDLSVVIIDDNELDNSSSGFASAASSISNVGRPRRTRNNPLLRTNANPVPTSSSVGAPRSSAASTTSAVSVTETSGSAIPSTAASASGTSAVQAQPSTSTAQAQPSTSSAQTEPKTSLKRPATEMEDSEEDEDQRCPICLESWSGTGDHRLCSLACGHLFGKSCIERWMKKGVQGRRCPQCNKPCKKGDIRPLFATAIKVKESSEEEKLHYQLQAALKAKKDLELRLMRTELKMAVLQEKDKQFSAASTSTASSASTSTTPYQPVLGGNRKIIFRMVKEIPIGEKGGGRVMSFCPWATQLSASRASNMSGFGVMKVQCERGFIAQSIESIHTKMIRDIAYFPTNNNSLLLTASLDRTAKLVDYRCNLVAQTYKAAAPLWSCCWDMIGSPSNECQMVTLGMTTGVAARYDMRMVLPEPVVTLGKREDQSPVSSLVSLPPGCCPTLPRGGLVVAQLNTCKLYVGDNDNEGVVLPFQPPFQCIRAEGTTGHLLVSTRAGTSKPTKHSVLRLQRERNVAPAQLFEPVMSLEGAKLESQLTRPCIANFKENDLVVAANEEESRTVPLWSVSTCSRIAVVPTSDNVLDICHFMVNTNNYFGLIMDKKMQIYQCHT
ncbi:hypothetical protein B566_EDAN004763 [Ephemera danica]|nr:hypothetical protein B566_EDAN004763 [Ephemera danica]